MWGFKMLTEQDLIDIDSVLTAAGGSRTSIKEESWLNHKNESIENGCDKYRIAQDIAVYRARNKIGRSEIPDRIVELADSNGCQLSSKEPEKKAAIVGYYGGGVDV